MNKIPPKIPRSLRKVKNQKRHHRIKISSQKKPRRPQKILRLKKLKLR